MGYAQEFNNQSLGDFLVEEAGLYMEDIKNIVIKEENAQFDIPQKYQNQLFLNLKNYKRFHRNLKLTFVENLR